ncbi:S8 family peptidase [Halobacteriaceae archaeon GCM10025711]
MGVAVTGAGVVGQASAEQSAERRIIGVDSRHEAAQVKRRAERVVREIDFGDIGHVVVGDFRPDVELEFESRSKVRYVEPESEMKLLGGETVQPESQSVPWGIDRIGAAALHERGVTGAGAHIAVIDSGIDSDHPDLLPNLGEGYAMVPCDECDGEDWDDDHDHGTHVAGIAAAASNGEGVVGVAPDATLHAVKAVSADGHGDSSTIADGLRWVADQGYDVASMSIGSTSESEVLRDAVTYAYEKGVLVVAAAGNEEPDEHTVHYPAAFPEAIAVGAIDEEDDLADFSLTGEALELVAPGDDIQSTVIDGYATYSGTSMATPHVSGAAALLVSSGYQKAKARERLCTTAVDLGLDADEQGDGLVDLQAAVGDAPGGGSVGFDVSTRGAIDARSRTATLNGELLGLGDHSSATVGFEYWVADDREATAKTVESGDESSPGMFSAEVSDLAIDTSYVFVAFAQAGDDEVRGGQREFTTDDPTEAPFSVVTDEPTDIEDDEAELRGRVTELNDVAEVEACFEFWPKGDDDNRSRVVADDDVDELEEFHEDAEDLDPATTYVAVAVAVSADGREAYGDTVEFTTLFD